MARMTDEEADALDEYYTKNPPKVSGDGTGGFFARRKAARMVVLDDISTKYLVTKAISLHKTPSELISDMVLKEIMNNAVESVQ